MSLSPFWTAVILPPANLLAAGLAGAAVAGRSPRLGRWIMAAALCGLAVLALPYTADRLAASLWSDRLAAKVSAPPGAVVILAADVRRVEGDAFATDLGPLTLERVRRGAALARQTGLPVLVTGGPWRKGQAPIARLMADSLHADFGIEARWTENRSQDTFENAEDSAVILREHGISSAYLVTHAWHMRRSELAFRKVGIETVGVPVRVERSRDVVWSDFVPRAEAWVISFYCLHEWVGYIVYAAFR